MAKERETEASGVVAGKFNAADLLMYIFCAVLCITILYPFWDVLVRSFTSPESINRTQFTFLPTKWSTGAYQAIFSNNKIAINFYNSVFRTVIGTILSLVVTVCASFALCKRTLPGRTGITLFFIFTMFFGGGLIPTYLLIKNLGLVDTIWSLIIPMTANVYNMVILRNNMQSLDPGLEESATLDGAGQFTILFRIIIPVSKPILATVALWCMVSHWNSWYDALLYTNKPSLEVLQLALHKMLSPASASEAQKFAAITGSTSLFTNETLKAAQIFITMLPILCTYPFIQKYFVKGILVGSFKG